MPDSYNHLLIPKASPAVSVNSKGALQFRKLVPVDDLTPIWKSFFCKGQWQMWMKKHAESQNKARRAQTPADLKQSWFLQLTSDSCLSRRVSVPLWSSKCCGVWASSSVSACTSGFSFSHFAKPLFFPALPWNLDFILGKVWEPESFQPASCQSGSVCVAWLVVALCSRTEIFREEPVTRVIALPSSSWCAVPTLGKSNISSWTAREGETVYFTFSAPSSLQKANFKPGAGGR